LTTRRYQASSSRWLTLSGLQLAGLILQLKASLLNVTVDTGFAAQYHAPAIALISHKLPGTALRFIAFKMSQPATSIPQKLFFKIGEVCELAGVQAHVLRYWETEFPMLAPQKNRAGQRTYRRKDVEMALRIKELLYDEQYTIAGAKKKLATEIRAPGRDVGLAPAKAPVRSLQPPPSLASRFTSPAPPPASQGQLTDEQRASLKDIAGQLRQILELLDQGDAELQELRESTQK
jgi:DNA-binding transcriptional MerR regulator